MPDLSAPIVNCTFPVVGTSIPLEHGYALYGALHTYWPALETYDWLQVGPLGPLYRRQGRTVCGEDTTLLFRCPLGYLPSLFPLAETPLKVDQGTLTLGRPWVSALEATSVLYSPFVTFKVHYPGGGLYPWHENDLGRFHAGMLRRLSAQGIVQGQPHIDIHHPRWLHIQEGGTSGYPVALLGCTPEESLHLQTVGLGGRRKMGCGVFVPWQPVQQQRKRPASWRQSFQGAEEESRCTSP